MQLIVFGVMISSVIAKDQVKELAAQVKRSKGFTNKVKTSNVNRDISNPISSKFRTGVIDDKCPEGINCIDEPMTGAVDLILGILATRLDKTGSLGYKSVQKSQIKEEQFKLKLEDEKDSDKIKNVNNKKAKKYNNDNTSEMEIRNLNSIENINDANGSDDEIEQNSEEKGPTTNGVEYFLFGGNNIVAVQ